MTFFPFCCFSRNFTNLVQIFVPGSLKLLKLKSVNSPGNIKSTFADLRNL